MIFGLSFALLLHIYTFHLFNNWNWTNISKFKVSYLNQLISRLLVPANEPWAHKILMRMDKILEITASVLTLDVINFSRDQF